MIQEQTDYETMDEAVAREMIGGSPETGGRSDISPTALKRFGRAARPETEHQIGGAHPRAPSPRRWGKQKGRTLLEMLGVLAIVGILSIAALVGFTYAMNKHRANETIYDVMLRGTNVPMVDENYASKPAGHEFTFPDLPAGTYYPMTTKKDAASSYYVEATGVTYRVCEMILKMNPTDIDRIMVGDTAYAGDSDICGTTDGLAMKFCFGEDGTICNGSGHGGSGSGSGSGSGTEDPCDGIDCGLHGVCNNGVCDCTNGYKGVHCEMPPACTTDEDCTDGEVCTDYECVCPPLDTPTECQEITSVEEGCDQLTNLPDGTVCSTGVCLEGSCCNPDDSQECCEAADKTWQEDSQTCCGETACVYRYTNPVGAIGSDCQVTGYVNPVGSIKATCQITGYVNPTTSYETIPDLNVSSCPSGQYCRVAWTSDTCSGDLGSTGASTMYGVCEQMTSNAGACQQGVHLGDLNTTSCPSGQYCRVAWTSDTCSGDLSSTGASTMYGVCEKMTSNGGSCKQNVHLTDSYLKEETGCSSGMYCKLTSSSEDYSGSLGSTGSDPMYGYCLSMNSTNKTCSN